MDNLTMMLEDNEKAMSILAENINDMMAAEIIYEFEGEEYVFKKCNKKKQQKILDEMLPENDAKQAFEDFIGASSRVVQGTLCSIKMPPVSDEMKESWNKHKDDYTYKRRRDFICHGCQSYFSDYQYRPLCDKCKEKK